MKKQNKKYSSIEWEVVYAVVILYVLICSAILAIHYFQPNDQESNTSSTAGLSTNSSDGGVRSRRSMA